MNYAFPNLAANFGIGIAELTTAVVRSELTAVGIPLITTYPDPRRHEVFAQQAGVLEFPKGVVFGFQRASTYYTVMGTHPLPVRETALLNRTWGTQVRIKGSSGGDEGVSGDGVRHWHVDTLQGFEALTQSLRDFFGKPNDSVLRSVEELTRLNVLRGVSVHPL